MQGISMEVGPDTPNLSQIAPIGAPAGALVTLLYQELKAIARAKLASERAGHTLSATALVHEAYVRLAGTRKPWADREQFFNAAAYAMQRVLVDHARRRNAVKRGGGLEREKFDMESAIEVDFDPMVDHSALGEHLDRLREIDPRGHQIVMLRYFAGLSTSDVADLLHTERHTVARRWRAIRAWLLERVRKAEAER